MVGFSSAECGLLELAALQPPAYLPPDHLATARQLAHRGLLVWRRGRWRITQIGLTLLRRLDAIEIAGAVAVRGRRRAAAWPAAGAQERPTLH